MAERFGNLAAWTEEMLAPPPALEHCTTCLVEYESGRTAACDIDDAHELVRLGLRPSEVVTRDRSRSQGWAESIWRERRWDGVRWWSYYGSHWGSFGLWDTTKLRVVRVTALSRDHSAVARAATMIVRAWR